MSRTPPGYKREYRKRNGDRLRAQERAAYRRRIDHFRAMNRAKMKREAPKRKRDRVLANYRRYGVSRAWFLERLSFQDGKCGICLRQLVIGGRRAESCVIDHCHSTGLARGILCGLCNKGLGLFGDEPLTLQAAADYLHDIPSEELYNAC